MGRPWNIRLHADSQGPPAASAPVVATSPCWHWPQTLCLVPASICQADAASPHTWACAHHCSNHHHQTWSIATGPGGTTEGASTLCPTDSPEGPHNFRCCEHWWPDPTTQLASPDLESLHATALGALRHSTPAHSRLQRAATCTRRYFPSEVSTEVWKRGVPLQMHRHQCKAKRITKNQGNMGLPKEHSKLSVAPKKWKSVNCPIKKSKKKK